MATNTLSGTPDIIKARILVVDDNPGTADTLARAIARISPNLEVISAVDAESALQAAGEQPIDLVITDMMMPGLNGFDLIERLRKRAKSNRFYSILVTAYDVPGLRESARRMQVEHVLIKPFSLEKISQIVTRALERTNPETAVFALPQKDSRSLPRLLLADDNPSNLALLQRYLGQEDYQMDTAQNGVETLEKLRASPPDLLLLDVNMPEMDGFQVLEQMRADPNLAYIPVIIITAARLDPVDMQYALNLGADDYITKPFDRRELLARIRTRLRVKEAEDLIRRRNQELALLLETGLRLSSQPDLLEWSQLALRQAVQALGAKHGSLALFDVNGHLARQFFHAAEEQTPTVPPPDWNLLIQQTRAACEDAAQNPFFLRHQNNHSTLTVPAWSADRLLGIFVLESKKGSVFTTEHAQILQVLALMLALSLQQTQSLPWKQVLPQSDLVQSD